jgi:murein DD-endopeptidase MepM/ murein hydrolase activator NlpD
LIGRVGMTGSATGPHLDNRLKSGGRFVNPLTVHSRQAPGEPIPTFHLAEFRSARDAALSRLLPTVLAGGGKQTPDAVRTTR